MMKKILSLVMAIMLCPVLALAEDSAGGMLTGQELREWAEECIARAWKMEPANIPGESQTIDGYEYVYDFATLYADTPVLSEDTVVNAIVITAEFEAGPRGVGVSDGLDDVLDAYYSENPSLVGTRENAVIYAVDSLPGSAAWAQVHRDGQRLQTVQYAVHDQLAAGGEGYTDMGVIYTMAENRVSAVRVYGLNSRLSYDDVSDMMYNVLMEGLENSYAMVPFSYVGSDLTPFAEADLTFSGVELLALTAESAVDALGEPMSDLWIDNGDHGYIRKQVFQQCELTWLYNKERTQGSLYMLYISADGLEGPRAVRIGDTFSSVYNRFYNGEGEYQEDGTEQLYGVNGVDSFGKATYNPDASATLRYGFTAADGRLVTLQMEFEIMELTEIMVTVE
nr:hypothetical protein [Clostridia bacterium]